MKYDKNRFNSPYIWRRDDILSLIPDNISKVLDVDCSIGAVGKYFCDKQIFVIFFGDFINKPGVELKNVVIFLRLIRILNLKILINQLIQLKKEGG